MPHHQFSIITQKFPGGPFIFREISRISSRVIKFQEISRISRSCRYPDLNYIPHWFLINMFLHFSFNRCLQALVHWCGFHAARGESEWCILLWFLAAQTVAARHLSSCWQLLLSSASRVHKCTELLWLHTRHAASQWTRPQSSRLRDMDSHSRMHLSETARVFNFIHHW